jgi:hypothetical protein
MASAERKDDDMEISEDEEDGVEEKNDGGGDGGDETPNPSLLPEDDPNAVSFDVRSVCVGSYRTSPTCVVKANAGSLSFGVAPLRRTASDDPPRNVNICLGVQDLIGVWAFWGSAPDAHDGALVVFTTKDAAKNIRSRLNMSRFEAQTAMRPYFCPSSKGS